MKMKKTMKRRSGRLGIIKLKGIYVDIHIGSTFIAIVTVFLFKNVLRSVCVAAAPSNSIFSNFSSACADDISYRDKYGLPCASYEGAICYNMGFVGFSKNEVSMLMSRCPSTCRLCKCEDDPMFRDPIGLTCSVHQRTVQLGSKCDDMVAIGYTRKEVKNLKENCPAACGECEGSTGDSVEHILSKPESGVVTIPTISPTINCADDPSYIDVLGLNCVEHMYSSCDGMVFIGFTIEETTELKMRCPLSCKVCSIPSPPPSPIPTSTPSASPTMTCVDDPTYVDRFRLNCRQHIAMDCSSLKRVGFSRREIAELMSKCPVSCGVCSRRTFSPSKLPSSYPTESTMPSMMPTLSPSMRPTMSPSVRPSSKPTPMLSNSPSLTPSHSPSKSPSARPSYKPSLMPSELPSHFPSDRPSHFPTNYPTKSPTKSPTQSPTNRPTVCLDDASFRFKMRARAASKDCDWVALDPFQRCGIPISVRGRAGSVAGFCRQSCNACSGDTLFPSLVPTFGPTALPSFDPSHSPSLVPSYVPTSLPSNVPSFVPSAWPSKLPSSIPSDTPTYQPSDIPSWLPSAFPSSERPKFIMDRMAMRLEKMPSLGSFKKTMLEHICESFLINSIAIDQRLPIKPISVDVKFGEDTVLGGGGILAEFTVIIMFPSGTEWALKMFDGRKLVVEAFQNKDAVAAMIGVLRAVSSYFKNVETVFVGDPLTPTSAPSAIPSPQPSDIPSHVPSIVPSGRPSYQPSDLPSVRPSLIPTDIPSFQPSTRPSMVPSENPSQVPSYQPSHVPSYVPSNRPSNSPSDMPSIQPSNVPSDIPSRIPSIQPSDMPSSQPSVHPSNKPSFIPSNYPSKLPSYVPSHNPTYLPSFVPSHNPTVIFPEFSVKDMILVIKGLRSNSGLKFDTASFILFLEEIMSSAIRSSVLVDETVYFRPNDVFVHIQDIYPIFSHDGMILHVVFGATAIFPSKFHNIIRYVNMKDIVTRTYDHPLKLAPITQLVESKGYIFKKVTHIAVLDPASPSAFPTSLPSYNPSDKPSYLPSFMPSVQPSLIPSNLPTQPPSVTPSDKPSLRPSDVPSNKPSGLPSFLPSNLPSTLPSDQPSLQPSPEPSARPTHSPSQPPSLRPSSLPSFIPSNRPSNYPSYLPSSIPSTLPTTGCHDRKNFRNRLGWNCKAHKHIDCQGLENLGFSQKEVNNLRVNCPVTCDSCEVLLPSQPPSTSPSFFPSNVPSLLPSISFTYAPSSSPSIFLREPSQVPSKYCHDNPNYKNRLRMSCAFHRASDCTLMGRLGFSKKEIDTLIRNCPDACGICDEDSPTEIPSIFPSKFPTVSPTNKPTRSICEDSTTYKSPMGLECKEHARLNCLSMTVLGLPVADVASLITSCPKSCNVCSIHGG